MTEPSSSGVTGDHFVNGDVSFWWRQLGGLPPVRPALAGSIEADVCIVGAGYTGLWTAYSLAKEQPDARIVVLEERFAGFGASGRNGGWLTNSITGGREHFAALGGRQSAIDFQRAMNETVATVVDAAADEGIDADIRLGGELNVAYGPAQLARARAFAESEAHWPGADTDLLSAAEVGEHLQTPGALGGTWHPHCASVHPAKLARGLAEAVERRGVTIYEGTRVERIEAGRAVTAAGTVRADIVIRATEGFTPALPGYHRAVLPMNSSMIITEPLPESAREQLGWNRGQTLGDFAHVYFYAQHTPDGRIAFGGRGVPYRYGSHVDRDGSTQAATVASLARLLAEKLPAAAGVPIDHAWAGVLGVPRNWAASVGLDRSTGIGWAGGYVGTGVATTNLAGRTLTDLILGRETELTRLPWVNTRSRNWEVEPLRWLAVRGLYGAYRLADEQERDGRERAPMIASIADRIAGR